MNTQRVRVRFAPSPTGYLHVGGARTALFNWLFARHRGGTFILRIEDTDRSRYRPTALADIMDGLRWLGLEWDEGPLAGGNYGPYFQSERLELYRTYAQRLVDEGRAYYCYCTPERLARMREQARENKDASGYDRHCRSLTQKERAELQAAGAQPVVRFKAPLEGKTSFTDVIRGTITVDNTQLEDLVLLKSDGFPTYHLANVVDDHLMEISHIMRADEWLPSVPKHVLMYEALGWEPPIFAHLPLILDPSGKGKLSKRKTRSGEQEQYVMVHEFEQAGYLPEALFNFLTLIGWSLDETTQIISREMAIEHFDLDRVNKSPAAFSYEKLDWMNGYYIRQLSDDELNARLVPCLARAFGMDEATVLERPETHKLAPLVRERIKRLPEAIPFIDFLYHDALAYDSELLVAKKMTPQESLNALRAAHIALANLEVFETAAIEDALRNLVETLGMKAGQLFGIIRIAATGKPVSPPLFESLEALGKERTLDRIDDAEERLATLIGTQ